MIKATERIMLGVSIRTYDNCYKSIEEYNDSLACFDMTTVEQCNLGYAGYCEPPFELMEDELAIIDRCNKKFIRAVSFEDGE